MSNAPTHVWYVAYGSNLKRERFMAYLVGGVVEGSPRVHRGCDDSTPPTGDKPIDLRRRLFFAGAQSHWGDGGVAFIDASAEDSAQNASFTAPVTAPSTARSSEWISYGRRYRITRAQFEQVVAQENGQTEGPCIDWERLQEDRFLTLNDKAYRNGRYRHLVLIDGEPCDELNCTFTSPPPVSGSKSGVRRLDRNPPALPYVQTIIEGIHQMLPTLKTELLVAYLIEAMFGRDGCPDSDDQQKWRVRLAELHRTVRSTQSAPPPPPGGLG